jgi:hypothetical protein
MESHTWAAKLRVAEWENEPQGRLGLKAKLLELEELQRRSQEVVLLAKWSDWFQRSFVRNLAKAISEAEARGVSTSQIRHSIRERHPQATTEDLDKYYKTEHQGTARRLLEAALQPQHDLQVASQWRRRLARWKVNAFPRLRGGQLQTTLCLLKKRTPPRVAAAVLRTALNGWCTGRRFQQPGECRLGCGSGEDSIEHYCCCQVTWRAGWSLMAIPKPEEYEACLRSFTGLRANGRNEDYIAKAAILTYAVYILVHRVRHQPIEEGQLEGALRQAVRHAVRGHTTATNLVDEAWRRSRTSAAVNPTARL